MSAQLYAHRTTIFFFFQAEDGIRDDLVTGVQTCALPIWMPDIHALIVGTVVTEKSSAAYDQGVDVRHPWLLRRPAPAARSEERRVGKECRSRWSPYH